ncbi:MAG: hypothetical protein ACRD0P_31510, partial [Stackebrandtia sp.]
MTTTGDDTGESSEFDVSGTADIVNQVAKAGKVTYNYYGTDRPTSTERRPPREMPAASRRFVNRSQELRLLDTLLEDNDHPFSPKLLLVDGRDGVGKTNLVARWAGRLEERFPDGFI